MNIRDAKLCLRCDEIFEGRSCPNCGDMGWYITKWVKPIGKRRTIESQIGVAGSK